MQFSPFSYSKYTVHRQIFRLFGGAFRIYEPMGNLVFYAQMKAFRLREDIRLYSDESMSQELLVIKARNIIDFSSAYDVVDARTNEKIGVLKRKGLKSMLRDEWIIMNAVDQEIGCLREDSTLLAVLRRIISEFLPNLIPQSYHGDVRGMPVCTFKQNFNPLVLRLSLDFSSDSQNMLDRRLGVAASVLLCAVEGRQR